MKKKNPQFIVNVEHWNVDARKVGEKSGRVVIEKVATRDAWGRFHSATNFRGTLPVL